jgi:hypothetical protein
MRKIEPSKPWAAFPLQVSARIEAFFSMSVITEVGDGCPDSESATSLL